MSLKIIVHIFAVALVYNVQNSHAREAPVFQEIIFHEGVTETEGTFLFFRF